LPNVREEKKKGEEKGRCKSLVLNGEEEGKGGKKRAIQRALEKKDRRRRFLFPSFLMTGEGGEEGKKKKGATANRSPLIKKGRRGKKSILKIPAG